MAELTKIEALARFERMVDPSASIRDLTRALRVWWCLKYNRPFKDPLLCSYTLEELFYEYMTHHFMLPENDPIKKKVGDAVAQNDEEWVKKQLAQMGQPAATPPPDPPIMGENVGGIPDLPEFNTKF